MSVTKFMSWLAGLAMLLALGACGGGGGGAGTSVLPGTGAGGTGAGSTTTTVAKLGVTLSASTVTAASPAQVTALLTTSTDVPIAGQVIKFSTRDSLGVFSAVSALTDSNGRATVNLTPASAATSGADTVVVTYVASDASTITSSAGFQLTATNVAISSFVSDVATIGAYGQTALTVNLSGTSTSAPVTVALSSACVSKGRATLTPARATVSTGQAVFTYRDQGCGATDTVDGIQASVVGTGVTSSVQLTLSEPTASSMAFVTAVPESIFLKGTGLAENANLTFQLRDANGLGLGGKTIELRPNTLTGGLQLDGVGDAASFPIRKTTDASGNVTVRVNAGTVPTPVRITATLAGTSISTVSSTLAIAVGLPSQNNFSLSQRTLNIEGYNIDGISNTYTIIASDRLGNPVPTGTAVNFVTEGGQVQAVGFTTTVSGLSSTTVNFQSSSPRPADGRVTVLAYALGEESFLDRNGNNTFDATEDFQDLGDVFLDRLFNRSYSVSEDQFIPLSITGGAACTSAASSLLTLGAESPSKPSSCDSVWGRAYVRKAAQTILATSSARPLFGFALPPRSAAADLASCTAGRLVLRNPVSGFQSGLVDGYNADDSANNTAVFQMGSVQLYGVDKAGVFSFIVADANPVALNPMAAGTIITVSATAGLTATVAGGSPVPSTLWPTAAAINYGFDDSVDSGVITVTFRSPSGLATSYSQSLSKNASIPSGLVACN